MLTSEKHIYLWPRNRSTLWVFCDSWFLCAVDLPTNFRFVPGNKLLNESVLMCVCVRLDSTGACTDVLCRQYCAEPYTAECVRVFSADGQTSIVYPELPYRTESVAVDDINRGIGMKESAESIASLLTRMCLRSVPSNDGQRLSIEVSGSISHCEIQNHRQTFTALVRQSYK